MILDSPIISGSIIQEAGQFAEIPRYTSVSSSLLSVSASLNSKINALNVATASQASRLTNLETKSGSVDSQLANLNSFTQSFSSSVATNFSASNASVTSLSASVASVTGNFSSSVATSFSQSNAAITALSASVSTVTGNFSSSVASEQIAQNDKINSLISFTGSYATTGSNTFKGTQIVSASMYVTGDLVVLGTSSMQNITGSSVSIGTNTVVLNTSAPAIRFGGISVQDSGSNAGTGSLWWDSLNNNWIYENPSGLGYTSAKLISGPQNSGSLGDEDGLTTGKIIVAVGDDHIGDSIMTQTNNQIGISGSLLVSGTFNLNNSATNFNIVGNTFGQSYLQSPNGAIVLNPGYGGVEIVGANNRFKVVDAYIENVYASNGVVSGSQQLTSSYDQRYVISGSITQTTWDNIASKPDGVVSGSQQVTGSLDFRYRLVGTPITFTELTDKPTLVSGSSQFKTLTDPFTGSFTGSFKGDGSLLTGLTAGGKIHTQSTAASTWTFTHNLNVQYPNVTVYNTAGQIVLPQSITATNVNTLVLEFGIAVAGYATAGVGGIIEVNGRTIKQNFTSSLSWRFEHNIGDRFINIQTFDSNYEKLIPETIVLTDNTSSLITFPEATSGWAIGTIGGDLPSISSAEAGYTLQVSQTAPYTASWTQFPDVTVTTALQLKNNDWTASLANNEFKVVNDGSALLTITSGSTEINNGTLTIIAESFANDYAEDYTELGDALILKGNGIVSGSFRPATGGIHNLGSVTHPWKELFVSTGSINLVEDGQVAFTITADTIVTTDTINSGTIDLTKSLPIGVVSGSSQINITSTTGYETFSGSVATSISASVAGATWVNISGKPSGLVSGSSQVIGILDSLNSETSSYAKTNVQNTFIANQTITGSLYITQDLVVLGSSSIQTISSSTLVIGTNQITLNTLNPSSRFAGLSIIDSGSSPLISASFLFDSIDDEWIFVHKGGEVVTSSTMISGPETYDNLGNETHLTDNKLTKATNGFHIVDSNISDDGSNVGINSNTQITGSLRVSNGITGSIAATNGVVSGSSQVIGILSSLNTYTSSQDTKNSTLATYTGSIDTKWSTLLNVTSSLIAKTGSLATTGSNTFVANQVISGSLSILGPNATGTFFNAQNLGAAGATFTRVNASSYPYNQYTFNNGNVGIGVTPQGAGTSITLEIGSRGMIYDNNDNFLYGNNGWVDGGTWKYKQSGFACIMATNGGQFTFSTAASGTQNNAITWSDKFTIQNGGNVGIGTSPNHKLDVNGDINIPGTNKIVFNNEPNSWFLQARTTTSTANLGSGLKNLFYNGGGSNEGIAFSGVGTGAASMEVRNDGRVWIKENLTVGGTLTENSSIRYKENVQTIKYGLDKVLQMRGVTYDKKNTGVKEVGVIAEEVYDILPEVVLKNEEGDIDSVSYGRIVGVLIEAIKEQQKQIEELKALIK